MDRDVATRAENGDHVEPAVTISVRRADIERNAESGSVESNVSR